MFASDWNTLSKPNNRVVGPNGVLMGGQDGSGNLPSPSAIANLAAWYDVSDFSRLTIDGSNRVQLIADKSAYSAENCLVLPGVSGNYASTTKYIPSAGVFRIESKVTWASYTPSGTQTLTATFAPSSSNRSWAVFLLSTGIIRVSLSSNGLLAGTTNVDSTTALDDGTKYVAIEIDLATPTTGSIKYEKSTDGVTWSSICAPVSYTQVALYDATASLEVGTNNGGTLNLAQNNTHWIKYYYNGALVRNFDATVQAKLATSWTAATTGETWTINSTAIALPARIHGARDLYMGTQASQPYYAAWSGTNYGYLNGASGAYFSTPDSAALSPTAEFEVIAEVTRVAGVSQYIIAQDDGGANRAYYVIINTSGNLVIRTVDTNAGVTFHTSTATMPVGNNFIKVTVNQDNGSTSETNFYTGTSRSGPWSALGAPVTGTARLDIVNKSNTVTIGNQGFPIRHGERLLRFVLHDNWRRGNGSIQRLRLPQHRRLHLR